MCTQMWFKSFVFFIVIFIISINKVSAKESNQFITVVNPIRISSYNPDPVASLISQYNEIKKRNLSSTWLLTSDVLQNTKLIDAIKSLDKNQEIGLFLEVTPNYAKKSEVIYNETGSWHHASSVFLSGYVQQDRIKLIDNIFTDFYNYFGYYPKSVGAWWIDSFSLEYMHKKYGVMTNLSCADQFSTDGYQIWGTYWSTPYYPSRFNSGIPSQSVDNKIGVLTIQWAHRDPGNGYFDSRYSTQDYFTTPGKNIEYFQSLVETYLKNDNNEFGQITIGLEGDFLPESYTGEFSKQLEISEEMVKKYSTNIVTMSEFSEWYRSKFPENSANHQIQGDISWFNTPYYRIGYKGNPLKIIDLRIYSETTKEPYYYRRNSGNKLEINLPSLVDTFSRPSEIIIFNSEAKLELSTDKFEILNPGKVEIPKQILNRSGVLVTHDDNRLSVSFSGKPLGTGDGTVLNDWSSESKNFFRQLKFPILLLKKDNWRMLSKIPLSISQDEIEALEFLKDQPQGKILVPDTYCLQCEWSGMYKPSSYDNSRGYIKKYSKKDYVKNNKVFASTNREESLREFTKSNSKYVYLTKYEGNFEKIPFSPGDLGIELLYENANAQIWVKK